MKTKKNNLFLVGPMGAGKTSVGRFLAKRLDKIFYDTDEEIEKRLGASLTWIFDLEGMQGYRQREARVIDELTHLADTVISTGGGCVETPEVRDYLQQRGTVIYMEVSLQTQLERLKRDKKRPLLQGENPQDVLIQLWEKREPYYETIADFTIATDQGSVRDVCESILAWLGYKNK